MLDDKEIIKKEVKPLTNNNEKNNLKKKIELIRKKRTPLTAQKRFPVCEEDPNYVHRWVNDTEGNIYRFQKSGWEHIDIEGKEITESNNFQDPVWRQSAFSTKVGGGITAYKMRIPKEIYDGDQERKFKESMDYERQLKVKELNEGYKIKSEIKADFGKLTE